MTLQDFFIKYFEKYAEMGFDEFKNYLKDNDYLKKSSDSIPKDWVVTSKYMKQDGTIIDKNAEELAEQIIDEIGCDYLTWDEAIGKSQLKPEVFEETVKKLKYWNQEKNEYTEKGKRNGIKYNLLSDPVIFNIKDAAGENDIDDVYLIQWFGPFKDVDECDIWLKEKSISEKEYNFYYAAGKKPNKHNKSYYLGVCVQDLVTNRLKAPTDPVTRDFRDTSSKEIWIGRFANKHYRSNCKENKDKVENVETALIYGFMQKNAYEIGKDPDMLLNIRKTSNAPSFPFFVANQWYYKDFELRIQKRGDCPKLIPEIMFYNSEENLKTW